ncbi:MAG: serine/threonine protein kinase [Acidobacteria bacterium]|nr:serine/threonine protein kinase [Acidobacteriota bacterium]
MTPERWQQVKEAFEAALEQEPHQRAAFIERTCAGDEELRREVESLLESHEKARRFFDHSAFDEAVRAFAEPDIEMAGGRIGVYEIIREIGKGGMGAVYLAARADEAFEKRVAIKVVKRDMDTDEVLRRFRTERQILARLEHPHIARLLDGGTTEAGHPYAVMEYIEGQPITDYCDAHKLSMVERLKLFRLVCSAVQYAHQNLVVHRDIKPTNILVTTDGEPKLLDFGIGKLLDPALDGQAVPTTITALRMMTPEYASPEQVRGEPISTASDVYSLGVVLYELLTGHRPYRITSRQPYEIMHVVCEQEAERPSTAISHQGSGIRDQGSETTDQEPRTTNRGPRTKNKLRKQLSGDLDNIVLMALRKEPARRYASVEQFSEDIRRHLEGLPVIARKDTLGYRAGKFIKRHKAGVAAAALVALTLIGGIVGITWQAKIAAEQRDRARSEAAKAQRINSFLQGMLSSPQVNQKGREIKVVEVVDEAARRMEKDLADQPEVLAEAQRTIGTTYMSLGMYEPAELHIRAAADMHRQLFGEEHAETARSLVYLGQVLRSKGDLAGSESLYRRALAVQRKVLPKPHADLVETLYFLGEVLNQKPDATAAEPFLREALEHSRQLFGNEHEMVAKTLMSLGMARQFQADLDEAESLFQESVWVFRKLPGRRPYEMGNALILLGDQYMAKGDFAAAEPLLREGVDFFGDYFGESHPIYAGALTYLGRLYNRKGDYMRAEPLARTALKIHRQTTPEGSLLLVRALSILGTSLTMTGRAAEGESYLCEAIGIQRNALSEYSWAIACTESDLAECLTVQQRYTEAESLLSQCYPGIKSGLGESHHRTKEALQRLVTLYEKWGKPDQAAKYRALLTHSRDK